METKVTINRNADDAEFWNDPVWLNRMPCYTTKTDVEFYVANRTNPAYFDQPEVRK